MMIIVKKTFLKLISIPKKLYYKFFSKFFEGKIQYYDRHQSYKDYIKKQIEKTKDPKRIAKWTGVEWEKKILGFRNLFDRNKDYLKNKENAICLGARTGQEVLVLQELGLKAVGLDLVPFPPYTIQGDIHSIPFKDGEFDFVFTNIFDHSLYPEKFVSEIERISKKNSHIIINLQLNNPGDDYSENLINDPKSVEKMFKNSELIISRKIKNTFDEMNYEFVLQKN